MLVVTAAAAAILALLCVKLSFQVIGFRRGHKVSTGDGGREDLSLAIRAHANLLEYSPLALILIACLEINSAPMWLPAILAIVFVVGRFLHPIGMTKKHSRFRVLGMQLTILSIIALAISNLLVLVWLLFAG